MARDAGYYQRLGAERRRLILRSQGHPRWNDRSPNAADEWYGKMSQAKYNQMLKNLGVKYHGKATSDIKKIKKPANREGYTRVRTYKMVNGRKVYTGYKFRKNKTSGGNSSAPKPTPPPPEQYKTVSGNASRGVVHNKNHTFQTPNGDTISIGADGKPKFEIKSAKYKDTKNIIQEAKQFGTDYIKAKYGEDTFNSIKDSVKDVASFVKSTLTGFGRKGMRNAGQEFMNKAPLATDGYKGPGTRSMFRSAGQMATEVMGGLKRQMNFNLENQDDKAQGQEHQWAQATSISHLINSQLRQAANDPKDYWDTWAQNQSGQTSIMNRGDMGVDIGYTSNDQAVFGTTGGSNDVEEAEEDDIEDKMGAGTELAQTNPFGAFGTNKVMYDLGEEPMNREEEVDEPGATFGGYGSKTRQINVPGLMTDMRVTTLESGADLSDWKRYGSKAGMTNSKAVTNAMNALRQSVNDSHRQGLSGDQVIYRAQQAYNTAYQKSYATFYNNYTQEKWGTTQSIMNPETGFGFVPNPKWVDPNASNGTNTPAPTPGPDPLPFSGPNDPKNYTSGFKSTSAVYNPWGYLEGSENNMYGPSRDHMARASMDALQLANAYFAPQRMELAYELGDMETDMRRLSANLGRQVDDPVLQAKLYKDASRAVRTLDIQQNTLAFQMVDARRKEELSNFQFYDQLAQEEHRLRLANEHFYKGMDLEGLKYNLANWEAQYVANAGPAAGAGTPPAGGQTGGSTTGGQQDTAAGVQTNAATAKNSIYARRYY